MSHRPEQIASVLRRAVQSVLNEGLADPRLDAMITVTDAKVAPDLRTATLSVAVTPERRESRVIHGLNDAAKHIRRLAGDRIAIAKAPEFVFKIDRAAKRQAEVFEALARVEREREASGPAEPPAEEHQTDPTGEPEP